MVAVLSGPTASGKSGLAMMLAEQLEKSCGATIINADASQLYSDLRLLSARPSAADLNAVPHRLYGVCDGAEAVSVAEWAAMARAEIAITLAAGRLPIIVGGSGLHLETLTKGIAPVPEIHPEIREAVRAMETPDAADALLREDTRMAARLGHTDRARVLRALEVVRGTGRSLASWQDAKTGGIADTHDVRGWVVAPPRDVLWARAAARLRLMMAEGALEEVEALMARALDAGLPVMKALGVRPLAESLAGRTSREQALEVTLAATRQYQKRQMTWVRGRLGSWPKLMGGRADTLAIVTQALS